MTGAPPNRHRAKARRWWPALAVVAVLAVVGGGLWLLPGTADPVPAAATTAVSPSRTASAPPTTAVPTTTAVVTTTEAPPTTSEAPPTTSEAPPATTPAPTTPAPAPAPAADPGPEGEVVALVNQERATAGCGPVVADGGLAGVARAHSADMRDRGYFSHTSPEGLSPFDRADAAGVPGARAENIAMGQPDAAAVMAAWMDSPGHRANILDCTLTRLGVGVAEGTGGPWWTQLFGS